MSTEPVGELFAAVYGGDEDAVVRLLRSGVDGAAAGDDGETALYVASVTDRAGIVRLLLAAGAEPDRLSSGTDLPLCGAACGGHTDVVGALLAAGAGVDRPEAFGFTALSWATQLGHAAVAERLLGGGADPGRPGPDGLLPLVAAARRGSLDTVRTLLRHGAAGQRAALDEARRWPAVGVAARLREQVGERDVPVESYALPEGSGVVVVAEAVRPDGSAAGAERQTGHGAIATLLEQALGIRSPFGELLDRARPFKDPENENWTESIAELRGRNDEITYRAAAALSRSPDPWRRVFAVDVLGGLDDSFAPRVRPLLRALAEEPDVPAPVSGGPEEPFGGGHGGHGVDGGDSRPPGVGAGSREDVVPLAGPGRDAPTELVRSLVLALAGQGGPSAVEDVLRFAGHPDAAVRRAVAFALHEHLAGGESPGIPALVRLTTDPDTEVREWSVTALGRLGGDGPGVRTALAARRADADPATAAEAAHGLALRGDPRAADALLRLLSTEAPGGYAHTTARAAAAQIADEQLRRRLLHTVSRHRG
ncbi:putative lyase [Streptomyces sp. YIM 130001]|uniref:HEAT repeat domain-containing protein n=1 Tax=Streptomyces sp. YIM 130001 TaxID=2259644 RepID=UPI000E649FDF|nr:HEAT repeat domain-containing protein [Streptomyces sp. YIM 130001]RII18383.1 putative lyase [Streptomyces sp. YIM 130001]